MVVHPCNPIPQKAEVRESEIQGHPQLQYKLKTLSRQVAQRIKNTRSKSISISLVS